MRSHGRHLVGDRGDMSPHFWQWGGGTEYLMSPPPPPPTLFGIENNHIFQYLFAFYGNFYWTFPDHVFTLYLYSDILSMYSIQRMRGNRNQSHKDLNFSKTFKLYRWLNIVASRLRRLQLVALNILYPTCPLNLFLANDAHGLT